MSNIRSAVTDGSRNAGGLGRPILSPAIESSKLRSKLSRIPRSDSDRYCVRKDSDERLKELTYYVGDCTAVGEPSIRQPIAKIYSVPGQACLREAPREVIVVPDIGERVPEDELDNLGTAPINGS